MGATFCLDGMVASEDISERVTLTDVVESL